MMPAMSAMNAISDALAPIPSASVRNILTLLVPRGAELVAGGEGLHRRVTWACRMRARLPAFETIRGGELALLALSQLRRLDETLPRLITSLHKEGVAAVAVAASSPDLLGHEALALADQLHFPVLLLPTTPSLEEVEREVITFVVGFRGESERKAAEVSRALMQLSAQGAGVAGLCDHLARLCDKWVVLQDAGQVALHRSTPPGAGVSTPPLPDQLADDALQKRGLERLTVPVQIRHEVVGYLSLLGSEGDFDYLERVILGQAAPIVALEFARERERSEVEGRYAAEALMDVLQGNYAQADEMIARARLLGFDLSSPQIAAVFELASREPPYPASHIQQQWQGRLRNELLRAWPSCWILSEARRVIALLPVAEHDAQHEREDEQGMLVRLERAQARYLTGNAQNGGPPPFSGGVGRIARDITAIPQSFQQARQALEIGSRLFGEGKLHSFAQLGIYRLLFHLYKHQELVQFYEETLGPLVDADTRNNQALIETLENFFRYNGNLSETARAMHFHRNSLLYRLGRIEELLGRSLEDPELRLSLQMALKIRHLLER
jgi:PucR family transcriptional regulator, purine catabolism regulatory protein